MMSVLKLYLVNEIMHLSGACFLVLILQHFRNTNKILNKGKFNCFALTVSERPTK